ncbi:hypothetical protein CEP54_014796 [Fusarium duplospermum]|uniref:Uncharacterized protein n=1 Tax=Fusarium duplospermum TaxID=1325734 RepID=A0A428NTT9_9HYPO|nr:hypothetical protein CEP54_014796 [Fusarium duplospermum]
MPPLSSTEQQRAFTLSWMRQADPFTTVTSGAIGPKYSVTTPAPSTLHIQLVGDNHSQQPHNTEPMVTPAPKTRLKLWEDSCLLDSHPKQALGEGQEVGGAAGAVGAGKTAAYLIPILGKLMGKAKRLAAARLNLLSFREGLDEVIAEVLMCPTTL